jgi:hypothetical protein
MRRFVVALGFVFIPLSLQAQDFNDGGTHTVNGPAGPIAVFSGTTVTIASGASVTGGVTVDSTSNLNVQGGNVLGASGFGPAASGGAGITSQGIFSGTGGMVQGGASVDDDGRGGAALVSMGLTLRQEARERRIVM